MNLSSQKEDWDFMWSDDTLKQMSNNLLELFLWISSAIVWQSNFFCYIVYIYLKYSMFPIDMLCSPYPSGFLSSASAFPQTGLSFLPVNIHTPLWTHWLFFAEELKTIYCKRFRQRLPHIGSGFTHIHIKRVGGIATLRPCSILKFLMFSVI